MLFVVLRLALAFPDVHFRLRSNGRLSHDLPPHKSGIERADNLSLFSAVVNALMPKRNQKKITSLIEEFQYPKYGPGMMWERCTELVEAAGCKVITPAPSASASSRLESLSIQFVPTGSWEGSCPQALSA